MRKKKFQKPFDKEDPRMKKGRKQIGELKSPENPFNLAEDSLNSIKMPEMKNPFGDNGAGGGFGKGGESNIFGGFEGLGDESDIGEKAKKDKKNFDKKEKPFDFFGGLKTDF